MTDITLARPPFIHPSTHLPSNDLYRLLWTKNLESTFSKLATGYKSCKLTGKPRSVKGFILLHTEKELVILYRHSGRLCEKVFADVDACLDFTQNRFGVTL